MFSVKKIVFNLFGSFYQSNDSYKENDPQNEDRGILQRYHEMLGDEVDANILTKTNDIFKNIVNPDTMLQEFIPIAEAKNGLAENIFESIALRRKMLRHLKQLNRNRGKFINYQYLFGLLGFDVSIVETYPSGTFDSGTFDSNLFDSFYSNRAEYVITLTCRTPFGITPIIEKQVLKIVRFNNPIHARLTQIIYANFVSLTLDFDELDFDQLDFN
jgi:hypothetical protein